MNMSKWVLNQSNDERFSVGYFGKKCFFVENYFLHFHISFMCINCGAMNVRQELSSNEWFIKPASVNVSQALTEGNAHHRLAASLMDLTFCIDGCFSDETWAFLHL